MGTSTIGTSLKAARERLGWSRETLAHRSGVSWSAISQIESGRRTDVRLSSLSALAEALGVTIDYMSGNATSAPPPMLEHRGLLFGSDEEFVAAVVPFLRQCIERSEAGLAVISTARAELIRDELGDGARGVEFADPREWYASPVEALHRFRGFIDSRLETGSKWVRSISEPMLPGSSADHMGEWVRCESMINLTLAAAPVTLVCSYDTRSAPADVIEGVMHTHPVCEQAGASTPSPSYRDPQDFLLGSDGR